jgi:hypothetical protein
MQQKYSNRFYHFKEDQKNKLSIERKYKQIITIRPGERSIFHKASLFRQIYSITNQADNTFLSIKNVFLKSKELQFTSFKFFAA